MSGFFDVLLLVGSLLLLQNIVYADLFVGILLVLFVLCCFFNRFKHLLFGLSGRIFVVLLYLVEFVLLEHFLLDKRLDWSLLVIVVDIHCFCGVARNDFLNHRVEFLKRRGIRGVVAFYLQIHLCVEILLHCFEGFKTSLILLAAKNDEHEIKRADKQERDKMHRAHFGGGKNPVTPEREQCKQHERYAEEHARAYVIVLFDQLVVNGRVADYVAGVTETNAEILHPCVTKGLRRFF